ncbi:MAG: hypothetical protein ACI9N9_001680, partial [Enterobacterales bacterium]
PWGSSPDAPLAITGEYNVQLMKRENGKVSSMTEPMTFNLTEMGIGELVTKDRKALQDFQKQTAKLKSNISGANKYVKEMSNRLEHVMKTLDVTPLTTEQQDKDARDVLNELTLINLLLDGDAIKSGANEKSIMGLRSRIGSIIWGHWDAQASPLAMYKDALSIAEKQYGALVEQIRIADKNLEGLELHLENLNAPWTPGRKL